MRGSYPYYGASGIIDYVNDYIFDGEYILLGEDGANIITRSIPLAFKIKGKCWVNNHAHVLEVKSGYNIDFVCNVLDSLNYENLNTGTAQPKLNRENCESILLCVPTLDEQDKIAGCLNSIYKDIDLYTNKLTQLANHKRGLVQHLFPQA